MSNVRDTQDVIEQVIDESVLKLLKGTDTTQKAMFNKIMALARGLTLNADGTIKQSTANLKAIREVKAILSNTLKTKAYKADVKGYTDEFNTVKGINDEYLGTLSEGFNPEKLVYKEVQKQAVSLTQSSLLGAGVDENIIKPVANILQDSITSGAMYGDMIQSLQTEILGDAERLGHLKRYSSQISWDAIEQFNRQYKNTVSSDLGMEWFQYSSGTSQDSRSYCKKRVRRFFHKKEIEQSSKGKWEGKIPNTTSSNIFTYAGGYNCRHSYDPVLIDGVPNHVKERNYSKGNIGTTEEKNVVDQVLTKKDSQQLNTKNGKYKASRKKIHNKIEKDILKDGRPSKDKTVYMSGGAPANGKSEIINSGKIKYPKHIVKIDPDGIKKKLPEYEPLVKMKNPKAAAFTHEESSFLSKDILQKSVNKNFDVLLDGTGDGSFEKLGKKIAVMKSNGHRISADYVTLDTDLCLKLAAQRSAKTGRKVPKSYIREVNESVARVLPQAIKAGYYDDLRLWDTNIWRHPRLIAEYKDGKMNVVNKDLYSRFLAKADPKTDFSKYKKLDGTKKSGPATFE